MWFLGMDVGTGGTRAVVVDADGKLISGASSEACSLPHAASGMGGAGSRRLVARRAGSDQAGAGGRSGAASADCRNRTDGADARRGDAG